MTLEQFLIAKSTVEDLERQKDKIQFLENILKEDTTGWLLEVRRSPSHTPLRIDHRGLLPDVLKAILRKQREEYESMKEELEKI